MKYSNLKHLFLLLPILVLTLIVYQPVFKAKLTNWDDNNYITNNKDITSVRKYGKDLLTKGYEGNYHPLTMLSFSVDYANGKLNPKTYHTTNIILHLLNICLLYVLLYMLTQNMVPAFVASIMFAVHPLNVESVAWISERKNLLFSFFFLASLNNYVVYIKNGQKLRYAFALLLFILSCLSKGVAVSLSVVLFAIDYFLARPQSLKKSFIEKIPFLILSVIFGLVAIYFQPLGNEELDIYRSAHLSYPWYDKLLIGTYNLGYYIYHLLVPINQAIFYPYPDRSNGFLSLQYYLLPLLIIAIVVRAVAYLIKNDSKFTRLVFFGLAFYVLNIGLVLQILPVGDSIRADRYVYIAGIGVFIILAAIMLSLKNAPVKRSFTVVLSIYVIFISFQSYSRVKVWNNSITLWDNQIEKFPELAFAYNQRGLAWDAKGELDNASRDYMESIRKDSSFYKGYNNLAIIQSIKGDQQNAINNFNRSLELNKEYWDVYVNRGRAKFLSGNYTSAIADFDQYLKVYPNNIPALLLHAVTYLNLGKYDESLKNYNHVIELDATNYEAFSNRAAVKSMMGNHASAVEDFSKVISLNGSDGTAYRNRGKTYLIMGQKDLACKDLEIAVQLRVAGAVEDFKKYCSDRQE